MNQPQTYSVKFLCCITERSIGMPHFPLGLIRGALVLCMYVCMYVLNWANSSIGQSCLLQADE